MYGYCFEKSELDGDLQTTLLFTLELVHRYGRPSKWFNREERVIIQNQEFGEAIHVIS